jgi:hypothetical protein
MGYVQETLERIEEELEDLHDYVSGEFEHVNAILHKIQESVGPLRRARDAAEERGI